MIQVKNIQKVKDLNLERIKKFTKRILINLGQQGKDVSLVFCDNSFITLLNKKYFQRDNPTDVIAFPLQDSCSPFLGEVIISIEEAIKNSRRYNTSLDREIALYIIHGLLHLLGYKDTATQSRGEMEKIQNRLLKELSWRIEKLVKCQKE